MHAKSILCLLLLCTGGNVLNGAVVSWVGDNGDWNTPTNWSTGLLPGPNDDVVIDRPAEIIVTHTAGAHTVNSIQSQEAFTLSGGSLVVSNTIQANNTFTLAGGTLARATIVQGSNGSIVVSNTATILDGVTVNGDLDVGRRNHGAALTILNGLVLNGTLFVGNPTNTSWYGSVHFSGSQTLSGNGAVVFGNRGDSCNALRLTLGGTTLTIGPGITIRGHSGGVGYSPCWGGALNVALVNQGSILAEISGGTISINAQRLINEATLAVSSNATLYIDTLHNVASGIISANDGTLGLGGSWTNGGTITASNATINLGGSFTLAELGVFNRTGGTVNLTGTFNGANLALDATTGSWTLNGGALRNTTVSASGGAELILGNATFDGVTLNGNLDVGRRNHGATLTLINGLVLNGTLYVGNPTNTSIYGSVHFSGSQTLSGNGTVVFGTRADTCNTLRLSAGGTALTIGPGITVRGHSGAIGFSPCWGGALNVAMINRGTILAELAGGAISIYAQRFTNEATVLVGSNASLNIDALHNLAGGVVSVTGGTLGLAGSWTNGGAINATNATVNLGGAFTRHQLGVLNRVGGTVNLTGTLDVGGGTLALDATSGSWAVNGGTVRNAVLTAADGAQFIFGTGTLDGVTAGDLDIGSISNAAIVTVTNGLVLNGTMRIGSALNQNYGTVNFLGTQILSGNGTVVLGANSSMYNGLRVLNNQTALTIAPGITVRGHRGRIGYNPAWGGNFNVSVTNRGTIVANVIGGQIDIMGQHFVNAATLESANGGYLVANAQTTINDSNIIVRSGSPLYFNGTLQPGGGRTVNVESGGVLRLKGNLLGDAMSLNDYAPNGRITLEGDGTPASPQLLEVMGRDLGSVPEGFSNNFTYGALALINLTYARLVDFSDNSSGSGAEAIYVNSLVVPAGTTLNLNGLHLYARTAQVAGVVINTAATSFATDFSSHPAAQGIQFRTTPLNSPNAAYWNSSGGYVVLTDAVANQRGKMLLPVLSDTEAVGAFTATMKVRLGGSTCCTRGGVLSPADGLSFNFAALNDPAVTNSEGMGWINNDPEEGVTNGISVCIDTWDNLGGEAPNIDLKVDGKLVATAPFAGFYRHGGQPANPVRDALGNPLALLTGTNWAELSVSLNQCGGVTVIYKGITIFDNVASGYVPRVGRFLLGGRTGGAHEYHHVDDININVQPASSSSLVSALIPAVSTDVFPGSPVGFVIRERDPVDTNSIQLRLDGSVVPAAITPQTNTGVLTYTVQYTPSVPFAAASTHIVELSFSHTNGSACSARRFFTTSIIGAGALFIEAEDFNYSTSDGVNPGQHIEFGAPDGSLLNRDATVGIDFQDDVSLNTAVRLYRPDSTVEAAKGPPITPDQNHLRGSRLITADWVIAWAGAGEWLNYTRTFPDAKYNVYVRWGSGGLDGTAMAAELSEVTSNPAQPNQTVRRIGEFRSPEPTGGWDLFFAFSSLQDTNGAPLAVRLHGKRTLRFTVLPGNFDFNYLAFVPNPAAPILRPLVDVTPPNGATTPNAYPRIDLLFTNRDAAVVTATLRLVVNGVDVTSSSTISTTPFGGAMSYQVPQPGYPVLSTVNVSASFTDDGPVPETQTNNWSFVAGGILITEQPTDQTTPLGGDATFSVSAIGSPPLAYRWLFNNAPIGGATNSTFTVTNAQAANVGEYKVVVSNPGGAVTSAVAVLTVIFPPPMVQITPPSTNVALGGMVTFCADAIGHGPFTYQWRQNGVTLTNETNVCLHIDNVQLSDGGSYSVIVANNGGATLSDPALLVLDVRVVQGTDSVTNRLRLTNDSGIGSGTNSFAGRDPDEPRHSGKPGGKSIWYEWRPSVSGIARFETVGSTFDTLIAVYVQCSSNELVEVVSDDDGGPNLTSIVRFNAVAGTTYLIAVDGFGGADGVYALSWNLDPAPDPLPIILQPPQSLTVAPDGTARFEVQAVPGARITSHCDGPTTNLAATLAYQWFRNGVVVPDATSPVLTIENVREADLGSYVVEVIQGSQTNRTPPASLQLNLTGQEAQNVQAQNKFEDAAETQGVELGADQAPAPLPGRPPKAPSGGGVIVRGYSGTQVFNTSGSTTEPGDEPICGVIGGASQWITFVCRETGALYLNTDGSSYNTVMAVFVRKPNNPAALEMVDCNNNGGLDGRDSALSVPVEGGETNFVMVDGVNGQSGTLVLNYSLVTPCVVTAPTINGDGNFQLRISGRAGMKLTVQRSTDMINWTDLGTLTLPTATFDYVDPSGTGTGQKFYRALMLP